MFYNQVFKILCRQVEITDMLNYRLVCKTWKNTIDAFIRQPCFHLYTSTDPPSPFQFKVLCAWEKTRYLFKSVERLMAFLESKPPSPYMCNPIMTGSIIFDDTKIDNDNDVLRFWDLACQLVQKFGGEIQYCRLTLQNVQWVHFYENVLIHMAQFMPRLVSMDMVAKNPNLIPEDFNAELRPEECTRFENLMELYPLSPLSNLLQLNVLGFPAIFLRHVLNTWGSPKVEILSAVAGSREQTRADYTMLPTRFPNIKVLKLSAPTMNCLRPLSSSYPDVVLPLQEVILNARLSEETYRPSHITFERLFHTLGVFERTLTQLTITLWGNAKLDGGFTCRNLRLRLPVLEYLDISAESPVVISSLDFLAQMQELKDLFIEQLSGVFERVQKGRVAIQFAGYVTRMGESNIWDVLPKLDSLQLTDSSGVWGYERSESDASSSSTGSDAN